MEIACPIMLALVGNCGELEVPLLVPEPAPGAVGAEVAMKLSQAAIVADG